MPFKFNPASIPMPEINFSRHDAFRITTNTDIRDLVDSMKRVGVINPPIVISEGSAPYEIVCGHRRIAAARAMGWDSIQARILPPTTDRLSCVILAISENSIERSLNSLETARALSLLSEQEPNGIKFQEIAKSIGLPHTPSIVKKMLPLCRLPESLQAGLISGTLALPTVLMLSRFSDDTAVIVGNFLSNLRLSLHKQRELIGLIEEIAINEDIPIESLLNSKAISSIVENEEMDVPRKAGLVRGYLKKRRYPHLSEAQESFERLKNELKIGDNTQLSPPPGFESNRYSLSFTFSTVSDIEKHKRTLDRLTENEEFVRFLSDRTT